MICMTLFDVYTFVFITSMIRYASARPWKHACISDEDCGRNKICAEDNICRKISHISDLVRKDFGRIVCESSNECPPTTFCNAKTNLCENIKNATQVFEKQQCPMFKSTCSSDSDCPCEKATLNCVDRECVHQKKMAEASDGETCRRDRDCEAAFHCKNMRCEEMTMEDLMSAMETPECERDSDCFDGERCIENYTVFGDLVHYCQLHPNSVS